MNYLNNENVNPEVVDALCELSNVGVGQASIVLGKMLDVIISIGIPTIASVDAEMKDIIRDDPEKVAIGILMSLEKTLSGAVLFVIDSMFLSEIVVKLTGRELHGQELVNDEESLSAISEVANIMAAAYMKSIGAYTGIRIYLSPVMVGVDMIGELISFPVAEMEINNTDSVCVDTSFFVKGKEKLNMAGRVIMFPNEASLGRILDALNKIENDG